MSISGWIHQLSDSLIAHNLQIPLFIILVLLVFAEAAAFVGFILPGETSLLIGGVLAHGKVWNLWLFLGVVIIAAIAGDSAGYEVGKHYGPSIKVSSFGKLVGEKRWRFALVIFNRYHRGAIFFGRAQALLRALIPALAGMNKVPYKTFLIWNAAGGFVFSTTVVLLGYEFANSIDVLEKYLRYWAIFFLSVVLALIFTLKNKLEHLLED